MNYLSKKFKISRHNIRGRTVIVIVAEFCIFLSIHSAVEVINLFWHPQGGEMFKSLRYRGGQSNRIALLLQLLCFVDDVV